MELKFYLVKDCVILVVDSLIQKKHSLPYGECGKWQKRLIKGRKHLSMDNRENTSIPTLWKFTIRFCGISLEEAMSSHPLRHVFVGVWEMISLIAAAHNIKLVDHLSVCILNQFKK